MTPQVVTVPVDCRLLDAISLMREKGIGAVLVKDETGRVAGIFTERDLLLKGDLANPDFFNTAVRTLMTPNPVMIKRDAPFSDVLALMETRRFRHLPVEDNGEVVGMVSLRDVMGRCHETLRAELQNKEEQVRQGLDAVKASEQRLRVIFDNLPVAITFADKEERITAWNPFTEALLGMTGDDLRDKPVHELYSPEEWREIRSHNIRKFGMRHHLETKVLNKAGEEIDVDISINVLKEENGEVIGSIGVMRDIRTRKMLMQMLDESVEQLADLKAGLDEHAVVVITDVNGKISYVNDRFCEMTKYSPEEMMGQNPRMLNSGHHPASFFRELWDTILSGKIWKGELCNRAKDGSLYWVETTIIPFLDKKGNPYQYMAVSNNITQRIKYEQQLEKKNYDLALNAKALHDLVVDREKTNRKLRDTQQQMIQIEKMATLGTLAAGLAHEVKNPLAIILQGVERLEKVLKKLNGDESSYQYVKIVKGAADRANTLVTSLLRYSRVAHLQMNPVDIHDHINTAIELIENQGKSTKIKFERHYETSGCMVKGDHIMLQQVFLDLFDNAFDAMPDGGALTISTQLLLPSADGTEHLEIRVQDTGTGIAQEDLNRIFDPFFTTKDEGKGTGLGLSTVFMILDRHKAAIQAESEPGKGATFIIRFPLWKGGQDDNDETKEIG